MTTDKVFILLLVILLPLTGCLDIADNAEAEDSDDENTTTTMPMVHSLLIPANSEHTITLTGDSTLQLEQAYTGSTDSECDSNCPVNWALTSAISMDMTCDSFTLESYLYVDYLIPAIGDETCVVVFTSGNYDVLAHFSEASLSAL
ncbi:hypothetical protein N9L27_00285 [Candidatus Poseidoniales archaeon]|nr:hypothetical protein [Candidatus Poseidoniales archaeon]